MFYKVDTSKELFKDYDWEIKEWRQFFNHLHHKNYDSPTEQWNTDTREELYITILDEISNFSAMRESHQNSKQQFITNPCQIRTAQGIISQVKHLRWNYHEFQIHYTSLDKKYKVWKYFLTNLLNDKSSNPYLTEVVHKPRVLWDVRLTSSYFRL